MAYATKFRFFFESVDGLEWTIDILKDGYSGSVLTRALGAPPVIRKDKSDCVCGTSLDLTAECAVDGEFEEIFTSDPFAYMAKVYNANTDLVWQGYVTPEMYSAPDITPPYDVRITCTDGLGELKLNYFEAQGTVTIDALLEYLLAFTGLDLSLRQATDLAAGDSSAAETIYDVWVNLDYMEGETCYDVLQLLLASIHSTITQDGETWLIIKETGLTIGSNSITVYSPVSFNRRVEHFGSLQTHGSSGYWPVGQMTREYVAPKKRIVLTTNNHYRSDLISGSWSLTGTAAYTNGYYSLPASGDQISNRVEFTQEVRKHLMMSIKVRNVGDGSTAGTLVVYVKLTGHHYGGTTAYLVNGTGNRRQEAMDVTWSPSSGTCSFEVQAPMESDTDQDYVTIDVLLPLYNNSARYYMGATALDITIVNGDSSYEKRIYGVDLYQYEQTKGFQKIVNIDNGARGEAPDVELALACLSGANNYNGTEDLLYGVPMTDELQKITEWSTSNYTDLAYLDLMARDYALSFASARVRLSGVLNTPPADLKMPVIFIDDYDSTAYIVESFSWDLYNDEVNVQMISQPSASMTVDDESLDTGDTDNPTNHNQGSPSGGGGGGGGSTVSISNLLSTGSRIATVTIDGVAKDIKASVVALSNLNTSGDRIATITLDGTAHDIKSPVYSLVSVRDRLTSGTKIATLQINLNTYDLYAPASLISVDIEDLLSSGFKIGNLVINGVNNNILIPTPDVSIAGTNAAPTVKVEMGSGNDDSVALPLATSSKAGIVSTAAQTFSGAKTFDRIYLGNSEARGMYIEYDDTNRAFKIVGNVYATGQVAAGQ